MDLIGRFAELKHVGLVWIFTIFILGQFARQPYQATPFRYVVATQHLGIQLEWKPHSRHWIGCRLFANYAQPKRPAYKFAWRRVSGLPSQEPYQLRVP